MHRQGMDFQGCEHPTPFLCSYLVLHEILALKDTFPASPATPFMRSLKIRQRLEVLKALQGFPPGRCILAVTHRVSLLRSVVEGRLPAAGTSLKQQTSRVVRQQVSGTKFRLHDLFPWSPNCLPLYSKSSKSASFVTYKHAGPWTTDLPFPPYNCQKVKWQSVTQPGWKRDEKAGTGNLLRITRRYFWVQHVKIWRQIWRGNQSHSNAQKFSLLYIYTVTVHLFWEYLLWFIF